MALVPTTTTPAAPPLLALGGATLPNASIAPKAPAAPLTAPVKENLADIGTLTRVPKNPATTPAAVNPAGENIGGAMERAGIPPSPEAPKTFTTPSGAVVDANGNIVSGPPGLPSYPKAADSSETRTAMTKAYDDLKSTITEIEGRIANSKTASPEEKELQAQLNTKKAALNTFDRGVLERVEGLYGQGRGATLSTIELQEAKERRTSALERLGLAQEVDTLTHSLALSKEDRQQLGDVATTEYNLATKKLDIALGITKEMDRLKEDDQNDARQYLLDVVNFSEGKAYEELDKQTQSAILQSVANSPITLDMVRTALKKGKETAAAKAAGELRSVAGVGVVRIDPKTNKWSVIVPENPTPAPSSSAPAFETYLENQNLSLATLTPQKLAALRAEYDAKYGNTRVDLGRLTPEDRQNITQAGLGGATSAVQSYYLNTPPEFRQEYGRGIATGKYKTGATLDSMIASYDAWYKTNKKGGAHDWNAILSAQK
ncbi:hypothetical protein KW797_00525 [Candidatus Parcubacteria bacterium]|nr:hypothetical protein [Candidatus Parcubacteria bacterium]